ncbi:hypothetical protein NQ314_005950 [Rhamnusium bicolor]|uniref:DDE Tnp4 domain-containing protein n=1 Tax=Rhamnusium bicolor TaxID=1586634 RepID=A0AAV8ZCQ1_9CUCU|nr:hypothetical protein NQ314_005950 [Rhamnusium bicolor]
MNPRPLYTPEKSEDDWLNISEGFYNKINFPNCLSAVDGKHIRLENQTRQPLNFLNFKKYHYSFDACGRLELLICNG